MLIVSPTRPEENCVSLAQQFREPRVPVRLSVGRSRFQLKSVPWRTYWGPAEPFLGADLRLIQRLNRLKRAWIEFLDQPDNPSLQRTYCWRYFGLLHHAMGLMADETSRPEPIAALRRIVGFESFPLAVSEVSRPAACTSSRSPIFVVSRLASRPSVSSPRHVPLLLPDSCDTPFYYYRQLLISSAPTTRLFLQPATHMLHREVTFAAIDRLTRLVNHRGDPYWRERAQRLADSLLSPLIHAGRCHGSAKSSLSVLDLGAGTGQLMAAAWCRLRATHATLPEAPFHFVDGSPVSTGRSFGLSRSHEGIEHVEYTSANYRALADNDDWLKRFGPFDWVIISRVFDNVSNFTIDRVEALDDADEDVLPHQCLSPRAGQAGPDRLMLSTVRQAVPGGTTAPQHSLRDYFAAMRVIQAGSIDSVTSDSWYLPVRRYNPACLITPGGQSVLKQLAKYSRAILIADIDLQAEHLVAHEAQFSLDGSACIRFAMPGSRMETNHFVITSAQWAGSLEGDRLW